MHRKLEAKLLPLDTELERTLRTLRSGREIEGRKEREKKTEEEKKEIGGELKQYSSEVAEKERTTKAAS